MGQAHAQLCDVRLHPERVINLHSDLELVAAMQGRLGIELAREHRPALILLDLHLPDIGGEEVLQELRRDPATAGVTIIVLSADATPGQVDRLLAGGASAYLTKPIDVLTLIQVLGESLRMEGSDTAERASSSS
ncbi:MAG TPA: response regulator [Acidimicrobiales bacterium]|nr:response regulator [Acidimicrobiales bacterium]